jgi:DNA-binding winged helix-turn-helix (wHTH) protein/TolB-like protein
MPLYSFGGFALDTEKRHLAYGERPVVLTAKVFDTLQLLVAARGDIVTRESFQQHLWPETVVEERNLTVNISTLRKALVDAGGQDVIETVPRVGYRITAPVETRNPSVPRAVVPVSATPPATVTVRAADISPAESRTTATRPIPGRQWHVSVRLAFIAGSLVMATALGAYLWRSGNASASPAGGTNTTIAVLPFVAGSREDSALGLGMADAVIARLSGIDGVTVRPMNAVIPYVNGGDPVVIGKALDADRVVEGVVQRVGDQAQVNTRIVDVASGETVLNERFELPNAGIFALQDAVSARVAGTLLQRVTAERHSAKLLHRPSSPEAYEAYLERRMQASRLNMGVEPMDLALAAYRRSVALDPAFAPAWSALARTYRVRSFSHSQRDQMLTLAREAAEKSLAIDPNHGEGHLVMGLLKYNLQWDWLGAERDFQRAADLDPGSADAFTWLGNLQRGLGEYDKAIANFERARANNPASARNIQIMAEGLWYAGRIDEAIGLFEQSSRLDPSNPTPHDLLVGVYDSVGRGPEAISARERAATLRNATEYLDGFRRAKSVGYQAVLEFDLAWHTRHRALWETAAMGALLNRPEPAIDALEECVALNCSVAPVLVAEPRFRSLRAHPRFIALAQKLHLTDALTRVR